MNAKETIVALVAVFAVYCYCSNEDYEEYCRVNNIETNNNNN